jgi:hypothetical protein
MDTVMLKPFRAISQANQPDSMTAEELDYKQLEEIVSEIRSLQYVFSRWLKSDC